MQPIRRFGFDAAILFSDILVIPHALGRKVSFVAGEGPKLDPIDNPETIATLPLEADQNRLAPVYETVARVKAELSPDVTLLGFCGAPWTVATYMIAGEGTPDQAPARVFAYRYPDAFASLIDRIADASIAYLVRQLQAGADAVQIFDTWAGILPPEEFRRWSMEPTQKIVAGVRKQIPDAKIIGFPRGAGSMLPLYAHHTDVDAVGLDWMIDKTFARENVQTPQAGAGQSRSARAPCWRRRRSIAASMTVMAAFANGPFIFNLGHGILPETPIENVERMIKRVRG